ncbi:hypothetical protein [Chondromyces apiculatus]|uniref:Cytochrome c domain-containing protein n=1 Tax=Chondromyces apiculatus DSM 436 TaxID=1192034 RepID=A0A017TBP1_9BACT|nr:hypothetical protein [Chondromyces apiculatus]EYF06240.1 Hypothetical protein CAP_2118 [Chondromyces apiculatus DSM 436]
MDSFPRVVLPFVLALAAAAGCFMPPGEDPGEGPSGGGAGAPTPSGSTGNGAVVDGGLPCDVSAVLATYCQGCHGAEPSAPMSLLTYEDLTAGAASDPARSVAELSVERMVSTEAPMPPGSGPTVPVAEVEVLRAWIEAGTPRGDCGGSGNPGPVATVCTSERQWRMGDDNPRPGGGELDEEGPWMNPGRACIACHTESGEFDEDEDDEDFVLLGGTVYPTLHEPDLCYGVDGNTTDARVVITDAQNRTFSLPLQPTGNFYLPGDEGPVSFPIKAKVVANGRERVMNTPQSSGDCNGCHTEQGKNGAPGRIYLP